MADSDDLELASEDDHSGNTGGTTSHTTHPVRKRIAIKLRQGGKGRGAASKKITRSKAGKDIEPDGNQPQDIPDEDAQFDGDVGKTLQFPPVKIGGIPGDPYHRNQKLKWDHKVNLLGEKIVDPLIHTCEKCSLPILIYGRMIPCKHVFCYCCAKTTEKNCPRCSQPVHRIEQAALGTVFVCTVGGTKHGVSGCHRTYLSQRDLQSHIAHRHCGAGREPQVARTAPTEYTAVPARTAVLTYNASQPPPALVQDSSGNIYRAQPAQHTGGGMPAQIVVAHPPPGMTQPPPGMAQAQLQPHQHVMSSRVIGTAPGGLPPGIMPPGSHTGQLPPPPTVQGMPPQAVLLQQVPMTGHPQSHAPTDAGFHPRGTNLITVQIHDDDYRRSADKQNSNVHVSFANQPPSGSTVAQSPHDNPISHYPQQHYPPPGPHVQAAVSYTGPEHHQMNVRPVMAHPGGPPPGHMAPPPSAQIGLVSISMPLTQLGPPGGPPPRLGPPPQSMHSGPPPQAIHSGHPPQAMHSGPPPQNIHSGPPPQAMHTGHPPQAMHAGPPPQGLRSGPPPPQGMRAGPPPHSYPAPPRHPQFGDEQHGQYPPGQPMSWTSPGPTGAPVQRLGPPGSRPSSGSSQSMPYYQ